MLIPSILFIVAMLTSILSGVIGMGGGILLFSCMTLFLTLDVIVPVHGVVQLSSNSSRVWMLRQNIKWDMFIPFALGAIIGVLLAVYLKKTVEINPSYPLAGVCLLILYTLFKPKKLPSFKIAFNAFCIVGLICGFLGIFVGAVGPFTAIFFIRDDLIKEEVIANKAMMQLFIHFLKLPAFLSLGFDYMAYWPYWLPLIFASLIGTKIGVSLLHKIDKHTFKILFKSALFMASIRILYKIIWHV
jgi:uncharacterized protein